MNTYILGVMMNAKYNFSIVFAISWLITMSGGDSTERLLKETCSPMEGVDVGPQSNASYEVGEIVQVTCEGNLTFSDLTSTKNFTCVAEDTWDPSDEKCVNASMINTKDDRFVGYVGTSMILTGTSLSSIQPNVSAQLSLGGSGVIRICASDYPVVLTSVVTRTGTSLWCWLCFPGSSSVRTRTGVSVPMRNVLPGEEVMVIGEDGEVRYEPVVAMVHKNPHQVAHFVELTTASRRNITITPLHYVIVDKGHARAHKLARDVDMSDILVSVTSESNEIYRDEVVGKRVVEERGVYAPLTPSGTVVVDSVVASAYVGGFRGVLSDPRAQHSASWPLRAGLPFMEVLSKGSHMPAWVHSTMLVYSGIASLF